MPLSTLNVHYEVRGAGRPVMLLSGLGGTGNAWGELIDLFAATSLTVVPDHPGTGGSPQPAEGHTIDHHAEVMADLIRQLGVGPVDVVGSSTGGAIAQTMALDHPDSVRSIVLADAWARPDAYFRHQFAVRKRVLQEQGLRAYTEASAVFLFGAKYFNERSESVAQWVDVASSGGDADVVAQRIDMIMDFDESDRLSQIEVPVLVVVGDEDICTPRYMSEELARAIPSARLEVLSGGHLIYKERPAAFHETVNSFLNSVGSLA